MLCKVYLCALSSSNTFCSSRVQTGCTVAEPEGRVLCIGTSGESMSERGDSKAMACVTGSRLDSGDRTITCSCVAGSSGDGENSCSSSGVADSRFCSGTSSGGFVTQRMVTPFSLTCFQLSLRAFSLEVELQQYLQAPPRRNHYSHIIIFVSSSVHLCFRFPEQWQVRLFCPISPLPWNLS